MRYDLVSYHGSISSSLATSLILIRRLSRTVYLTFSTFLPVTKVPNSIITFNWFSAILIEFIPFANRSFIHSRFTKRLLQHLHNFIARDFIVHSKSNAYSSTPHCKKQKIIECNTTSLIDCQIWNTYPIWLPILTVVKGRLTNMPTKKFISPANHALLNGFASQMSTITRQIINNPVNGG